MLYILGREVIEGFQQGSIMTRAADSLESGPKSGQPRESVNSKGRCAQFLTYMSEQCMFLCKQHDLWTDDMLGSTHVPSRLNGFN